MEINHKSWSFSREIFDKIYSEQVPIKRMVYDTATNILIAQQIKRFTKYLLTIAVCDKLHEVSLKYDN